MSTTENRFWAKIKKTKSCWEWLGAKSSAGYGQLRDPDKLHYAHRLSWIYKYGPIPNGLHILHKCDNPGCVNPDHLVLGTHQENMQDMVKKNRFGGKKLKPAEILAIKAMAKSGAYSQQDLANIFKVTQANISYILLKKSWKHL